MKCSFRRRSTVGQMCKSINSEWFQKKFKPMLLMQTESSSTQTFTLNQTAGGIWGADWCTLTEVSMYGSEKTERWACSLGIRDGEGQLLHPSWHRALTLLPTFTQTYMFQEARPMNIYKFSETTEAYSCVVQSRDGACHCATMWSGRE